MSLNNKKCDILHQFTFIIIKFMHSEEIVHPYNLESRKLKINKIQMIK